MTIEATVLVAFGSNMGDEEAIFFATQQRLITLSKVQSVIASSLHRTAAVGGPANQPDFLNAAFRLQTSLSPTALHQSLIDIETGLGRERRVRWGARRVDLDLLLYDDLTRVTKTLTVPHPRMSFRRFVLDPTREIAGEMTHPVAQMTITELWQHLDNTPNVILWVTKVDAAIEKCHLHVSQAASASGWRIHLVDDVEQYERHHPTAKLVAWGVDRPGCLATQRFRGPQLQLPAESSSIAKELLAAIDAMK